MAIGKFEKKADRFFGRKRQAFVVTASFPPKDGVGIPEKKMGIFWSTDMMSAIRTAQSKWPGRPITLKTLNLKPDWAQPKE
jgi:hypothetical protein